MIRGVYVKGGEVTEVELESMRPERELQVFTFERKKKGTYKRYEGISIANAVTLGISCGLTCGSLMAAAIAYADWPFRLLLLVTIIVDAFIVLENLTKEVER